MSQKTKSKTKLKTANKNSERSPMSATAKATADALNTLKSQGVVAALRGQKQGIADLLQTTDRSLSIKLSVVYGAGLIVEKDDDEWNALCEAEEWVGHPKLKPKREDALRAVLRLAVGFDGPKADSSVHRYYKALAPLFLEKIPANEVPARIHEAGGIEKMRQSPQRVLQTLAQPLVLAKLHNIKVDTSFKLWATALPMVDGVTELKITKLKPVKEQK